MEKLKRVITPMSVELRKKIELHKFTRRLPSRAGATRDLIELGLLAAKNGMVLPDIAPTAWVTPEAEAVAHP